MISGLNPSLYRPLSTLHDPRCQGPCKTRFRLTGCAFAGRELNPLNCCEWFQVFAHLLSLLYPPFRGFLGASWAHARRKLKEVVFDRDGSEIAAEGLRRIAEFCKRSLRITGFSA